MSKRQSPHGSEDESQPHEEDKNTKKQIKRAQTENHQTTLANGEGNKKKQSSLTSYFTMNENTAKLLDSPNRIQSEEEEEEKTSDLKRQSTGKTEVMDDNASDISYKSKNSMNIEGVRKDISKMNNVLFYMNQRKSQPMGDFIDNIHKKWYTDYRKLEIHHGYIQWLFPNFYGSAFNGDAYRLGEDEAEIFRNNEEIAERLVKSYEMILGFYGMKLADKMTGRLERADNYLERYKETLITSLHNHLRVRRILTHLNVVGFRKYAIQLVDFIEIEMYGEKGGYEIFKAKVKKPDPEYIKKVRLNPLAQIIRYDQFPTWKMYGEVRNDEERELLHKNCFTDKEEDYADSVYFRTNRE